MSKKILIIDDQYGRCGLGGAFKNDIGPEIFSAFKADRRNLCSNYGIFDLSGDSKPIDKEKSQCDALFCPAQHWDRKTKRIENDLEIAIKAVERGWPFKDGSRWALVLLDLAFVCGELDCFGDPQERTMFGRDVILPELKKRFGEDLPIVVLSSTPREENNEKIRRLGALDFIQRIPNSSEQPGSSKHHLSDMLFLHALVPDPQEMIVGHSLATLKMLRQARRAARNARTILLHGEIGTGKNLLAKYIHDMSPRKDHPFELFNAANRSAELQADELFGHWEGAYTGATTDSAGIWERCDKGTILIDEVADIDKSVQLKLMEPIEERHVSRMGGDTNKGGKKILVDVLTILATNRDLGNLAKKGRIKEDFLSRINTTTIEIPPLRERKEDIPDLASVFVKSFEDGIKFLPEALEALCRAEWKDDNIRGVRRLIENLSVNHPGQIVTEADIPPLMNQENGVESSSPDASVETDDIGKLLGALQIMPDESSRAECRLMGEELAGVFPELAAYIVAWSLQLCGDVTNAARFLSGNPDMDTTASKQFIKKILKIDVKHKSVIKAFVNHPESQDPVLKDVLDDVKE